MEAKIQAELMSALKEKNAEKTSAIREIKTAIMKFKTSPGFSGTCSEADILGIIQKISKHERLYIKLRLIFEKRKDER